MPIPLVSRIKDPSGLIKLPVIFRVRAPVALSAGIGLVSRHTCRIINTCQCLQTFCSSEYTSLTRRSRNVLATTCVNTKNN